MTSEHTFQHLVITRFSYRWVAGSRSHLTERQLNLHHLVDPLDPRRLEKRFHLFEAVCLPSVVAQEDQEFTWVVLIDPQLPSRYYHRLQSLVAGISNVRIHVYDRGSNIEGLQWLKSYINRESQYVITTCLDDDDGLCAKFIEMVHQDIRRLARSNGLPGIRFFCSKRALQWDFVPSREAPLGYLKPWLRQRVDSKPMPVSTGWSVLCKYPELDLSVFYFPRQYGNLYVTESQVFDNSNEQWSREVQQKRDSLRSLLTAAGEKWDRLCMTSALVEIDSERPCAVVVNSTANIRYKRLVEGIEIRQPVIDERSFQGIGVNLEAARTYIQRHAPTWSNFFYLVLPAYKRVFRGDVAKRPSLLILRTAQAVGFTYRAARGFMELGSHWL